jgi:hypothetical protein
MKVTDNGKATVTRIVCPNPDLNLFSTRATCRNSRKQKREQEQSALV